ncbi:cadherin-like domain-containing protein [Mycolicibacterium sp. PAM1]|uniref:WD40 domain-containing protein n=2 Tax=Mycolicibacterium TaxID=1866885 RepID=A4T4Q5_MYCGI|nr:conserved hypothetical protein [Mycolicibacterium gilvum PYR-GCK]MBV5246275.1 cadherin-like domain-containing protein [Mycolicibacterium sp. PAM1]
MSQPPAKRPLNKQDQSVRRAAGFPVRQWLKLGAASAGMGAALLGFSLLGPATGTAAADGTGDTSSAQSSSSAGDSPSGKPAGGADREAGATTSGSASADDSDSEAGTASRSRRDVRPADDEDAAEHDDIDTGDIDTGEAEDTEAAPQGATKPRAARLSGAAAEPAEEEQEQQQPAPPVKAPDWLAPRRARGETVSRIVDTWTQRNQAWINSLNVSEARKAELAASFAQFKRTFLNQAPTLNPIQVTGLVSGAITGRIEASDADGDRIVYRLAGNPREGSVVVNADGTYTYTPGANFDGVDTFRVVALDAGSNLNLLDPLRGVGTSAVGLINQNAITFEFTYTGADWTEPRQKALEDVAAGLLEYFRVDRPVTLTYAVRLEDPTDPERGLAAAGSDYISKLPGYWPTVVQQKLQTGRDVNGAKTDGWITWNFADHKWALGDVVSAAEYDFTAVAVHELMHSFGFLSSLGKPGSAQDLDLSVFDRFIVTARGTDPFVLGRWQRSNDPKLEGEDGGLYFGGPNAVLGYDGYLIPLFTPWEFKGGSSVLHVDDLTFTGDRMKVMTAETPTGPSPRLFSAMEIGILRDLGYTVVLPQQPPYAPAALIGFVFLFRTRRK